MSSETQTVPGTGQAPAVAEEKSRVNPDSPPEPHPPVPEQTLRIYIKGSQIPLLQEHVTLVEFINVAGEVTSSLQAE